MIIQTIINKAIKRLELECKLLTPEFYTEAFCKEAEKAGVKTQDCYQVDKFLKTLNEDIQKELKNYKIKTMGELTRFLIAKINRTNTTLCSKKLDSYSLLTKKILQVVTVLHNLEATELAKQSMKLINSNPSTNELELFRQYWIDFITKYDDTFLNKLKTLGKVDTTNLKKTVENLNISLADSTSTGIKNENELSKIASLLVSSFVPSIASSANDKIATLSKKIKNNPNILNSSEIENDIKSIILLRISLDKDNVKDMIESLDGVIDKLPFKLTDMIQRSNDSTTEIQKIKTELKDFNENQVNSNFKLAHQKLLLIASSLEENTKLLSKDLKNYSSEVKALSVKINTLEKELEEAKQASKEDFLTKLYNKRALDEFVRVKEAEYERYGHNFTIVMFDIDNFKSINDNYGHDAGDAILSAFAKIMTKEARSVDIIGRFGGEEFMAILGETDLKGGVIFAEKVRKYIQNARFIYKDIRLGITVSAGVSERKLYTSIENTIKSSDEYLYKAKKNGRNQVVYKKK